MRYTLLFLILILITWSCSKNKFSSTPSLKFKSVNTTELHPQGVLNFALTFTDAEGDFSDSGSIYVEFMQRMLPNCAVTDNPAIFALPVFPATKNEKGTINVSLNYGDITPQCSPLNDTTVFHFVLKDNAGHVSDTASSPTIIIYN
ncbi:MAG TPA: hypothetical protein VIJ92_10825 [Ginsengibacter sp.]